MYSDLSVANASSLYSRPCSAKAAVFSATVRAFNSFLALLLLAKSINITSYTKELLGNNNNIEDNINNKTNSNTNTNTNTNTNNNTNTETSDNTSAGI